MKRKLCVAGLTVLALTSSRAAEAGFGDLVPSTRWLTLGSPYAPKSYAECDDLRQSFQEETSGLSAQHDACLQGAPQEPAGSAGCTKLSCQALHTARDSARRRADEQTGLCRQRVGEYLAEQRAEEQRQHKAEEAAEQERHRQEVEEAAERAERDRAERERAAEKVQEEHEQAAQEADEARDRAAQEAREEQERSDDEAVREQERAEREAGAAREEADRESLTDRKLANLMAQQQAAEAKEKGASARRAKDFFERLGKEAQEARKGAEAAEIATALGKNPFEQPLADVAEGPLGEAAANRARGANRTMLEKGLDLATEGLGPAEHDSTYDQLAEGVDAAHDKALKGNPFAKEVSGLALSGVQHMQRKVLGETTELARQIDSVGKDAPAAGSRSTTFRASPRPALSAGGDAESGSEAVDNIENPFARPAAQIQRPSQGEQRATVPAASSRTERVAALDPDNGPSALQRDSPENPFSAKARTGDATSTSDVEEPTGGTPGSMTGASGRAGSVGPVAALPEERTRRVLQRVQERLDAVGFDTGPADGVAGARTRAALRAFQKARGLDPTGEPNGPTLKELGVE